MKTDEQVEEILKNDRKRLFWRLYGLPWIALTLCLTIIILILLAVKTNLKGNVEPITPKPPLPKIISVNATNSPNIDFYREAVINGHGEYIINTNFAFLGNSGTSTNLVEFRWKNVSTECINSQIESKVRVKLQEIRENDKKAQKVREESREKELYTECARYYQIEAISNGLGKWVSNIQGQNAFKWKTIPEIAEEYTRNAVKESLTECNTNGEYVIKREYPYTLENHTLNHKLGIDLEGELVKACLLSIEGNFWGKKQEELKNRVKEDVAGSIHGIFNGYETLNRENKKKGR